MYIIIRKSGEQMKDYSSYFKGPSLNEAKKRSHDRVNRYDDAYHIPADMIKDMDVKQTSVIARLYREF